MKNILLYKVFQSAYARIIAAGVGRYARQCGDWHLIFAEDDARMFRKLEQTRLDGVLVFHYYANELIDHIHPRHMVSVYSRFQDESMYFVTLDNPLAGARVAEEFFHRGFRHFGYVGLVDNTASRLRLQGFASWLNAKGHAVETLHLKEIPAIDRTATTLEPLGCWVRQLPKPTAILAFNDFMGWYAIEACNQQGLKVPQEIAVIGVDNETPLCELSKPQLSSVTIPSATIGYRAASTLDLLMKGGENPPRIQVHPPAGIARRQSSDVMAIRDPSIAKVLAHLHEYPERAHAVDDLAQTFGMSRRSLQRRFADATGTTIREAIQSARMHHACELLADTRLSIEEIGVACGFEYPHHFSRVFKQRFDHPPSVYRTLISVP